MFSKPMAGGVVVSGRKNARETRASEAAAHGGHEHGASPTERLWAMARAERHDIGVAATYAAAVGLTSLAVPIAVQALVNTVSFGVLRQPVVVMTAAVLLGLGFAGAMRAAQAVLVEALQQRLFVRTAVELSGRLPRAEVAALDREHGPELVNRFFEVLTLQKGAAQLLLDGLALALQTAVGAALLAFYHPVLLAFDVLLIAALSVVLLGLGRGATATSLAESRAKYAVAAWLEELARHPIVFHTDGGRAHAARRIDELCSGYVRARKAHFRVVLRQIVGLLALHAAASAALLGVGAALVLEGQLTLGQLVAAELVVSAVLSGLSKLGKHLEAYYDLLAAADKLGHLADIPLESERGEGEASAFGPAGLSLRALSLPRGTTEGPDRLDVEIGPGDRVALLGPAASGKSTLLDVLHGLREPEAGALVIDGVDSREVSKTSLRAESALVRGVEIFDGTVAENVRAGRDRVSPERVREALSAVGLLDELLSLPGGLHERLTTGGAPLSAEQARRLMVARALAGKPRLLLVDEALDGIDDQGLGKLEGAVLSPEAPHTLVLVTRRPDLLAHCTATLRLDRAELTLAGDPR